MENQPEGMYKLNLFVLVLSACFAVISSLDSLTAHSRSVPTHKPTKWHVTVDVTNSSSLTDIKYTVDPKPLAADGGCPTATGVTNSGDLQVCQNDLIEWQGKSKGDSHKLHIFTPDGVMDKDSYSASNGATTSPPGKVSSTAAVGSEHKYSVQLYDTAGNIYQSPDPKIIIGGGT